MRKKFDIVQEKCEEETAKLLLIYFLPLPNKIKYINICIYMYIYIYNVYNNLSISIKNSNNLCHSYSSTKTL